MIKILKSNFFFFLLLFFVIFIVYGKAINFGITNIDDDTFILRKAKHLSNLKNIPQCFLKDCYFEKKTQYYRPILTISFSIEHFLFGDKIKVFHITNIFLYVIALFIIYIFLLKLNFNTKILKFLILIFAVHPILSSVPVWIPARNDTLLTIFFLSSLINFIDYIKTDKTKYLILHFLFFSLALFSKETAVLLILIYPMLLYSFNLKITSEQTMYNIGFLFILFTIYFILRHHAVLAINISVYLNNYLYFIKNIIFGIMFYIEKTIYPSSMPIMLYGLNPTYQTFFISFFVIFFLIYVYFKNIMNRKNLIFALLFSLLSILPTFAQEEYAFLTHRLIISLVGIFIILTALLEKTLLKYPKTKLYLVIVFIFIFTQFSFCSFFNINKYKDSFTYWNKACQDAPNYYLVYDSLAKEYNYKKDFENALNLSLISINLKNDFDNYLTLATIFFDKKDYQNAKNIFLQLSQIDNSNFFIYNRLSNIFLFEKDYSKAVEYARNAVEKANVIDTKISTLENLAKIYATINKFQEAINTIFELLKYDNNNPTYYKFLSMLYEDLNDYNNSFIYIRKALEIEPTNEECINQLKNIETKLSAKE